MSFKYNGPRTGQQVKLKSTSHTRRHGSRGQLLDIADQFLNQWFEIEDHIPLGTFPGINPDFDIYEIVVQGYSYYLHENDFYCLSEGNLITSPGFQYRAYDPSDWGYGREYEHVPPELPKSLSCCPTPNIIPNSTGKGVYKVDFLVCTCCKQEVKDKKGTLC